MVPEYHGSYQLTFKPLTILRSFLGMGNDQRWDIQCGIVGQAQLSSQESYFEIVTARLASCAWRWVCRWNWLSINILVYEVHQALFI